VVLTAPNIATDVKVVQMEPHKIKISWNAQLTNVVYIYLLTLNCNYSELYIISFQISETFEINICQKNQPLLCMNHNLPNTNNLSEPEFSIQLDNLPASEFIISIVSTHNGVASLKSNSVLLEIDMKGMFY